jgi:putative ABC transport system substrate-binding protein
MRRREFIAFLGGVAAIGPLIARAEESLHRLGVLEGTGKDDPVNKAKYTAFEQALHQLGWTNGGNLRIDYRFGEGDPKVIREQADELVALKPAVILVSGSSATGQMLRATRSVPIVFAIVPDPCGLRVCAKSVAARWQRYGLYAVRIQLEWKVGGIVKTAGNQCLAGARFVGP